MNESCSPAGCFYHNALYIHKTALGASATVFFEVEAGLLSAVQIKPIIMAGVTVKDIIKAIRFALRLASASYCSLQSDPHSISTQPTDT